MKTKKFKYVSIVIVMLVLLVAVSTALGQEPEPPDEDIVTLVAPLPEFDGEPEELVEEDLEDDEFILAQPPYMMNYQGYLTNSSGVPLNGTYTLVFRLYDAFLAGNLEWGPETHANVPVTNGIFQVALGSSVNLYPNDFDEALFLGVWVNGTYVSPRQTLRPVPYAFGLVPGAEVQGDPQNTSYALIVDNTGTSSNDRGIYAEGNQYGIYANSLTDSYSVYSADTTYSSKGFAGPDTYVWVPVNNAVIDYGDRNDPVHLEHENFDLLIVEADAGAISTTSVNVLIPFQVERPYGRNYILKSARVYYRVNDGAKLETGRIRGRDFSNASSRTLGENTSDGTSLSFASYTITADSYNTITTSQAPNAVELYIDMPNSNSTFYLYGVRLQLDSSY